MKLDCMICKTEFEGEEPKMCCSGRECGCMGQPIDPIVCSEDCYDYGLKLRHTLSFLDQENKKSGLFARKIIKTEQQVFEIGLHPVIYGWRIRGGFVDSGSGHATYYALDLCAGDDNKKISLIYTTTLNIILKIIGAKEDLNTGLQTWIPSFKVKPIFKDSEFPEFLSKGVMEDYFSEELIITADELEGFRNEFMELLNQEYGT